MVAAVVFDMDGVIVDSEQVWDAVREQLVREWGGSYSPVAQRAMMGMSSAEWSRYMHDELGLEQSPAEINDEVVRRMLAHYRARLPLLDGAVEVVRELATSYPLAVASSSNRPLIEAVLETAGIATCFAVTVSSEEVPRGKPSPDVYLEAARRLGVAPERCAAVEDSAGGIRRRTAPACSWWRIRTRTIRPTGRLSRSRTSSSPRPGRSLLLSVAGLRRPAEPVAAPARATPLGPAARSRCGRRGPSRSRGRRRARPCAPRSGRSRGRLGSGFR